MKIFAYDSVFMQKPFIKLIAVMVLLAALGGYQLTRLVFQMNDAAAQRGVQLLEIEEHLDDAAISLGRQIQEWKNMLLRADNTELVGKHRQGFKEASIDVQYALWNARQDMQTTGMATAEIEHLIAEHKAVLAEYLQAYARINPMAAGASNEVDRMIIGVDRNLQNHLALVKAGIAEFAKQQLYRTSDAEQHRYLLFGLLGAVCLLLMGLLGIGFAYRLRREHEDGTSGYKY